MSRLKLSLVVALFSISIISLSKAQTLKYPIVGTNQTLFYDTMKTISQVVVGEDYFGQNANYHGNLPSYKDNGDGTITDNITGLMWQQSPDSDSDNDIDYDDKMSYDEAVAGASSYNLAGYSDWRLPTIKELYSLIIFSGKDPSGYNGTSTNGLVPFIDTKYFDFNYGDQNAGERIIDAQFVSSTLYVAKGGISGNEEIVFGVNFADGRIKGYESGIMPGQTVPKQFYVLYVRGNSDYGNNNFQNNNDGTITDHATGLMWMQDDNGQAISWKDALDYAENSDFAGYSDWRLPDAKELQSIVDYTRSPSTTSSAAIDPIFNCTKIKDEGGNDNYAFYWSNTTHTNWTTNTEGSNAAYVCFGQALGWMEMPPNSGNYKLIDVHGAGAQRSDPKFGDPNDYPYGHGPQGDVIRISNYVRLVRNTEVTSIDKTGSIENHIKIYPNPANDNIEISSGKIITSYIILDAQGKEVLNSKDANVNRVKIDISEFKSGLYFINILDEEGTSFSYKFLKN